VCWEVRWEWLVVGGAWVALILNNLAGVLSGLGKPDQARPLLERALRITEAACGPEQFKTAVTLNSRSGVW
jgi:Tetratricopeptide repeat